jgi:RimJ/RimL family protein N-acetyltransferase
MHTPTLETDRLLLDPLTERDEDAVYRYCQDDELQRWVPVPVPYERASARFFVGKYAKDASESPTLTLWAIRSGDVLSGLSGDALSGFSGDAPSGGALSGALSGDVPSGGALLGVIELRFEPLGSATVGFWLGRDHRGQGIMTEALQALVEYAFAEDGLALTRIHWESLVGNYGSAIVARRAGFRFEGVSRRSLVHRDIRVDSWQAVLLRSDSREPTEGWPL